MSGVQVVRADDVAPTPWRNGHGVTRELLHWPPGDGWRMRVSLADVTADAPFSPYPGVERWFAVVEGNGVALRFAGRSVEQRRSDTPLRFDGADAPHCTLLAGATRDLNLLLRDGLRGALARSVAGQAWEAAWHWRAWFGCRTHTLHADWPADAPASDEPGLWIGAMR